MKCSRYEPWGGSGSVLQTILAVTSKYGKTYGKVGQRKILILLKTRHGIQISRSTLCEWMKYLRDGAYIKSFQGTHLNKYGKVIYAVNRYYLLPRALKWLNKLDYWREKVYRLFRVRLSRPNVKTLSWNLSGFGDFLGVQSLGDELKGVPLPMS
jgi:hypothetical protein